MLSVDPGKMNADCWFIRAPTGLLHLIFIINETVDYHLFKYVLV